MDNPMENDRMSTTLRLARTPGTPLEGVERAAIRGHARGAWERRDPRQRLAVRLPGVRLSDLQQLPAELERQEHFADASIRVEAGGDGVPVLLLDPRRHAAERARKEW